MLKSALFFALAAIVIGLSAVSLLPDGSRPAASATAVAATPLSVVAKSDVVDNDSSSFRETSIPADAGGQFHAKAMVQGQLVEMMVDTGATVVTLSAETAARLGVFADPAAPKWRMNTANGVALASPVVLRRVSVGTIEMTDVQAVVMPKGAMAGNLLGASFLKRLASVEQRDGMLRLKQ